MRIRVICCNIRFDNPKDEENSWANRKTLLARILLNHNPDLIGTQEGRRPQLLELGSLLHPPYHLSDRHRNWLTERMYPCIFHNPERVECLESGDLWLSLTPHVPGSFSFNSAFPRLATWIKGQTKTSQKKFIFANLHLDHLLPDTRAKQIDVFINEFSRINQDQLPFILSGDFNEGPQGHVRQTLLQTFENLYDPWIELGNSERTSHHHFQSSTPNPLSISAPASAGERIDWILVDKRIKAHHIFFDESFEDLVLPRKVRVFPSDHFPLITELEIL